MKKMPLKKVMILSWALFLITLLFYLVGAVFRLVPLLILGCVTGIGAIVFMIIFQRCPHCGGFVRMRGLYCSHCGHTLED